MPSKQEIIEKVAEIRKDLPKHQREKETAERYLDRIIDLCEPELDPAADGTFTNEQANHALKLTRHFTDDQLGRSRTDIAQMEKYIYG